MAPFPSTASDRVRPRARDLGVPLEGTPGPLNAITDVSGVEVGHRTPIAGATTVWPRGKVTNDPVFGSVLIINTHSVGVVRDAYPAWLVNHKRKPGTNVFDGGFYTYPVVAETYDGHLDDINGFHVKQIAVASLGAPCREDTGSIIIVVATDAPVLPHQAKRLARRATMGLARTGSTPGHGSGDIFIAFSTANPHVAAASQPANVAMLPNDSLNPIFEAAVQATEEAIVNAMVGAETMTGINGHTVTALPHDRLRELFKK